jgi:hypothetical protein
MTNNIDFSRPWDRVTLQEIKKILETAHGEAVDAAKVWAEAGVHSKAEAWKEKAAALAEVIGKIDARAHLHGTAALYEEAY